MTADSRKFDSPFSLKDADELKNGIELTGPYEYFGYGVSGVGDVNGDGVADLIIGAPRVSNGGYRRGSAYVLFGGDAVSSGSWSIHDLMDGTNGFEIKGSDNYDYCGRAVGGQVDLNGDGYNEIIVGCYGKCAQIAWFIFVFDGVCVIFVFLFYFSVSSYRW